MRININITSLFFFILIIFFSNTVDSQSIDEKIADITTKYFDLNRENIHLEFNKKTYLTNENVWFKGFVFDKKSNISYVEPSNVNVVFYNTNGLEIEKQLLHCENGVFDGAFKLNSNLKSGIYYFQVYTNWDNNFTENESSIFNINVLNPSENYQSNSISSDPFVEFHPEGNVFLEGVNNTIGISILDCKKNRIEITNGQILDDKGNEISKFETNIFGYGKCDLPNTTNQNYKLSFDFENKKIIKYFPKVSYKGISLSVNNYSNESKTFINIKTNDLTRKEIGDKKLHLSVSQYDKNNVLSFQFDTNNKQIVLSNEDLFSGINIVRIIDDELNLVNERIIYKSFNNKFDVDFVVLKKNKDSIQIKGIFNGLNPKVGLSILPQETICENNKNSIFNSLLIEPFLKDNIQNPNYFFENSNKKTFYDLDLFFLNQKSSKYDWNSMKNPPVKKYLSNNGITVKGILNDDIKDKKNYKIQMFSLRAGINEMSEINEKNEFYFSNVIINDSLKINFALVKNGEKLKELNYFPQIINPERPFQQKFEINKNDCISNSINSSNNIQKLDVPKLKSASVLQDVIVKQNKKPQLINQNKLGNFSSRGFKISEEDTKIYQTIVDFIASNGYYATENAGSVVIKDRARASINGAANVRVYLDDNLLDSFDQLYQMSMKSVDEVYINRNGTNLYSSGGGVIKIYTNKTFISKPREILSKSLLVKNAFSGSKPFITPEYASVNELAFKNYGIVFWIPTIEAKDNLINFEIPNLNQKSIKILVEGFSEDGKFISEIKTLQIE